MSVINPDKWEVFRIYMAKHSHTHGATMPPSRLYCNRMSRWGKSMNIGDLATIVAVSVLVGGLMVYLWMYLDCVEGNDD